MQFILGICCLFETFLLSCAVLAGQVWLCGCVMASVLACLESLLAKHCWGSCFLKSLFCMESVIETSAANRRLGLKQVSYLAQKTYTCQRKCSHEQTH